MNPFLAQMYGLDKTAAEADIDLSQVSAADYLQALAEVEGDYSLDKMASDGSFEYFDNAGRIMAHAYADEMSKVAGGDDVIEVDLDRISAEDLAVLVDEGYEFDMDKTAGSASSAAEKARAFGGRAAELLKGTHVRKNLADLAGPEAGRMDKLKMYGSILRGTAGNDLATAEARKSLAAQSALASALGVSGAGGAMYMKKRRNNRNG